MDKKLNRRVNILTGYAILSLLAFGYLAFAFFKNGNRQEAPGELTVKRINLTGEDGSLRMVISNETRQHSGRINGKAVPQRERPAGIIFFDNNGNECGGLVFGVSKKGGKIENGMSFTMDNYNNDQVVQIVNDESYEGDRGHIRRGLVINEYPIGADMSKAIPEYEAIQKIKDTALKQQRLAAFREREGGRRRLFLGRSGDNLSGLFLYDTAGRPRMKLYVDQTGSPKLEVLDEQGQAREVSLR